jgi:tagatose-6-phosphate ketose/aldose isomerase
VAAAALADQLLTSVHHLVVCCNGDSDLAHAYAEDDRALVLLMPPETHDVGFAMTSSFTSMVLGCWFALTGTQPAAEVVDRLARGAEALLAGADEVAALAGRGFGRVAYLGSGPLAGLAQEAALKLLELTAGDVVGHHDTPLGFRHGPKAMLTDDTLVVVLRSTDAYAARYDDDIVAELTRDLDPRQVVVLSDRALPAAIAGSAGWTWRADVLEGLDDVQVAVVYAVFAQLFALRSSIVRGLTPDNPFPSGEVNRVVRGVSVHPYPA